MEPYLQLEQDWAKANDLDPAGMVACSSGTAALHLALEALQLPQGLECITGDFNMIAVPRAIVMAGLVPVFVDCDDKLLIDFDLLQPPMRKPYPSAVIATHVYGRRCNMEWFDGLEEDEYTESPTYLIEDLAEAHGMKPYRQTDVACWSFYRNKIVAGEEGGAVWFRNPKNANLARQLRSLGFTDAHDFNHIPRGHNYRMSNLHAEPIIESIQQMRANLMARRWIESTYDRHCPVVWRMPPRQAPWVYDLRIPRLTWDGQAELVKALNEAGIAARQAFKPMSLQAEFRDCRQVCAEGYSRTVIASSQVFYLPIQPGVTTEKSVKRAFSLIFSFPGCPRPSETSVAGSKLEKGI